MTVPEAWAELDDAKLEYVLTLHAAGIAAEHVQLYAFLRFSGLRIVPRSERDGTRLYRHGGRTVRIADDAVCGGAERLGFIQTVPDRPQRPARWRGARAADADLHGVKFGEYLQIENLYQQYIEDPSGRDACIDRMAALLYPGLKPPRRGLQRQLFVLVTIHWLTGLKIYLSRMFPDLFRPAAGASDESDLRAAMLAQVRALTGGDVTKEDAVLNVDTWAAFAELNEKAREARQLNSK